MKLCCYYNFLGKHDNTCTFENCDGHHLDIYDSNFTFPSNQRNQIRVQVDFLVDDGIRKLIQSRNFVSVRTFKFRWFQVHLQLTAEH